MMIEVILLSPSVTGFELDLESMLAAADLQRTAVSHSGLDSGIICGVGKPPGDQFPCGLIILRKG